MIEAVALGIGVLIGVLLTLFATERSFQRAARFYQTGRPDAPVAERDPRHVASPEDSAHRQITKDAIERGALDLIRMAKEEGVTLSMKDAKKEAESMWANANPLGGAH